VRPLDREQRREHEHADRRRGRAVQVDRPAAQRHDEQHRDDRGKRFDPVGEQRRRRERSKKGECRAGAHGSA
jgi:hypothetical protein